MNRIINVSSLRLPSLDGLLAFEAAARHGTFERAAEELFVTGGAIAKRVAAVEQLLGIQLLERSGRSLTITAVGKEYLDQIKGPLRILTTLPLHRRHGHQKERLRIYSPPTFARQILMPRLEEFTVAHPDLNLEVLILAPNAGSVHDADIRVKGGNPADIGGTRIMSDYATPLVSPSLLQRFGPINHPADLASVPLLRTPLESWGPWFDVAHLDWPEPTHGPSLMDLGLVLEAAVSGQGVALVSPALARPWLQNGRLIPVFPQIVCAALPYCLLPYTSQGFAKAFAHWLTNVCDQAVREASEYISSHV